MLYRVIIPTVLVLLNLFVWGYVFREKFVSFGLYVFTLHIKEDWEIEDLSIPKTFAACPNNLNNYKASIEISGDLNNGSGMMVSNFIPDTLFLKPGSIKEYYQNDWYNGTLNLQYIPIGKPSGNIEIEVIFYN